MTRDETGRHIGADAGRRLLQIGRLPYRPDAAGRAGADHACPFRSCPRRPWRRAGNAGDPRPDAAALRREFRRLDASGGLWRKSRARRRQSDVPSRRPCARLGADRGRGRRPARGCLRRLQECRRSDLRAVRAGAVRRVHHRGDVRAAGVPPRRPRRRDRNTPELGRAVSRARPSGRRLFARQGAARDRAIAPGRLRRADLSARRHGEDHALLRKPRRRARRIAAGQRRHQAKPRRHHHDLPAVGLERSVDATLPRSARRLRLGLDAGARASAAAGRVAAAGDLRSCRLGWPHRDHRGHWRGRNLGYSRPRRRAGALVRYARTQSPPARHRRLWRRGRRADERRGGGMNRFAELLDRLAYEPARNNKLRLITDYFRFTPDPERGWALAALTGALSFPHAKAGLIRSLIAERTDPVLFELSYDYVGDLSETVALMWPSPLAQRAPSPLVGEGWGGGSGGDAQASTIAHHLSTPTPNPSPQGGGELSLTAVIETLSTLGKAQLPKQLARWLDALDETGRWALIKLVTGGLRVGVSARLAKTAAAALSGTDAQDIELLWPGLTPPYLDLFAWLEGRADKPTSSDPAPFRPPMLAHALDDADLAGLEAGDFLAEWKWDGIRVQAVAARQDGATIARLYSRTGEDISKSFPDLLDALHLPGAMDGELLIMRERRVQSFNVLQQRLNRKTVTPKLIAEFPAHLRAYDLLADGEEDLRERPFAERRARLENFVARLRDT